MFTPAFIRTSSVKRNNTVQPLSESAMTTDPQYSLIESMILLEDMSTGILTDNLSSSFLFELDGNENILEEGFKDMMGGANEFFKKVLKSLKEFFDKAGTFFSSYFRNFDDFIKKHEDKILSSNPQKEIKGYNYTLDVAIPNTIVLQDLVNEFSSDISSIDTMKINDLKDLRAKFDDAENMDKIRASILDSSEDVSDENFDEVARAILRDGDIDKKDMVLDSTLVEELLNGYKELKVAFGKFRTERVRLEKIINDVKKNFEKGPITRHTDNGHRAVITGIEIGDKGLRQSEDNTTSFSSKDNSTMSVVNYYYSFRFHQMKEISKYMMKTLSFKSEAFKEAISFYEKCLRSAALSSNNEEDED